MASSLVTCIVLCILNSSGSSALFATVARYDTLLEQASYKITSPIHIDSCGFAK